jgi:phage terminase large subunit-like protein
MIRERLSQADLAILFLESLEIPEGPRAGQRLKLAPYQRTFVRGALAPGVNIGIKSIGRGGAKTALASGLALGALLGAWDSQPRREIPLCARTREQARIAWNYCCAFARTLPDDVLAQLEFRRQPRFEIEYTGDGGGHVIRAIAADGKSALGMSPTFALLDERASWPLDQGNELEHAILTALGKRGGRALIVSTSAADDSHPFSKWLDDDQPGVYRQEHRAPDNSEPDNLDAIRAANPGAEFGIGASLEWLAAQARRAIAQGGTTLTAFRLYHLNQRVSSETRDLLLTVDEWLRCEQEPLPPRDGQVAIGIDLGGSASMSAAAFYWPTTGRLEALGWFPSKPDLMNRGQADSVGTRYHEMQQRGELFTLGDQTVPVAAWLTELLRHVAGQPIVCIVADRYKQSELGEALDKCGNRIPVIWRGFGFKDGGEDCERFRRACYDGHVKSKPSLLLRSAFADAVCLRDPANNIKLAKARSLGRIDAAAASVLAVAEGIRRVAREPKRREAFWA